MIKQVEGFCTQSEKYTHAGWVCNLCHSFQTHHKTVKFLFYMYARNQTIHR